jgi:hypothetical protein
LLHVLPVISLTQPLLQSHLHSAAQFSSTRLPFHSTTLSTK